MKLKNISYKVNKDNKMFIIIILSILISIIAYLSQESFYSFINLIYIALFLSSHFFQIFGGLIGGLAAGIVLAVIPSEITGIQGQNYKIILTNTILFVCFGYITGAVRKCSQKKIIIEACNFDVTTGLPNQVALNNMMDELILNNKDSFTLVIVSIENIFEIFSMIGYSKSNHVLSIIAELFGAFANGKNIFLFNCDYNFKFLLKNFSSSKVHKLLKKFKAYIEKYPLNIEEIPLHLEIELGAALYNEKIKCTDEIIKNAFTALDYSRNNSTGFGIYNPEMEKYFNFTNLISEFKKSITREDFYLEYQPKLNLTDGKIHGVEALVRWNHPELGIIPPLSFIPQLEKTNYINDLTYWILRTVINDIREWTKSGRNLKVSINLTPKNIQNDEFVHKMKANIRINMPFTKNIEFELTETDLMTKLDTTRDTLNSFKRDGIKIYIDDFGTGYSSLAYLKTLPIDFIKIDRIFIKEITKTTSDKEIVKTTIDLAHALGKPVVAEGVEDIETLNLLKEMNCDEIQGYYFAKPMKKKDLEFFLKNELTNANKYFDKV